MNVKMKALSALFVLAALWGADSWGSKDAAPAGRAPLDLSLPLYPGGKMHSLAKDRGNVVLLDIWATWCEPCRRALPLYERLVKQYGPRKFKVYAINVDEDPDEIPPFINETRLSLPVLVDRDAEVVETKLGIRVMPTSFVLDKQGRVRHVHEGFAAEHLPKLKAEIEALLEEKGQ
jgi:thiol-disulfide isomerase/thioredoxin